MSEEDSGKKAKISGKIGGKIGGLGKAAIKQKATIISAVWISLRRLK